MTLMALTSVGKDSKSLENYMIQKVRIVEFEDIDHNKLRQYTKIFINGDWIGVHDKGYLIVKRLKKLRRIGKIPDEVSIIHDITNKEIRIFCDAGRIFRPLFIVKGQSLVLNDSHVAKLRNKEIMFSDLLK